MVQNHLLQLMCLVAIEPPNILDANTVRDEKLKVLKSLRPIDVNLCKTHTVKGQYTRGKLDGKKLNHILKISRNLALIQRHLLRFEHISIIGVGQAFHSI